MTEFEGRTFVRQRIVLDGRQFPNCVFRDCLLVYEGEADTDLRGSKFEGTTQLQLVNRAMLPFRLLHHMYHSGMTDYVEHLFETVRQPPRRRALEVDPENQASEE